MGENAGLTGAGNWPIWGVIGLGPNWLPTDGLLRKSVAGVPEAGIPLKA